MPNDLRLRAFELSVEIARLPKYGSLNQVGGYQQNDSIDVILTRAKMIEQYLKDE